MRWILAALLLLWAGLAMGQAPDGTPELLYYTIAWTTHTEAGRDSLCRADILVDPANPTELLDIRARNPKIRIFSSFQPQFALPNSSGENPWWKADTLWNVERAIQWYCYKNPQWILKDTAGNPLMLWSRYILNWTAYCPVGTYGSAIGLRPSQWIPRMFKKIMIDGSWNGHPSPLGPWNYDDLTTMNGCVLEFFGDCLGSVVSLPNADPNLDGIAEGVSSACLSGGDGQPLSLLMKTENNNVFRPALYTYIWNYNPHWPLIINEMNRGMGPSWRTEFNGMKNENFLDDTRTWWNWFYGKDDLGGNMGRGYHWAESAMARGGTADSMIGWDQSMITVHYNPGISAASNSKRARLATGTVLLGDGRIMLSKGRTGEQYAWWDPCLEWQVGQPTQAFQKTAYSSAYGVDTLYTREFTNGIVKVNPNPSPPSTVGGVPYQDATFTEWTGACCYESGSCAMTTPAACTGTYQGNDTVCSPNPCVQPPALPVVDHPRLYLRLASNDAGWLDTLRTRCTTTHSKFYTPLKALVDARKASWNKTADYAAIAAFVALIEDTQPYKDYVRSILSYNIQPARQSTWLQEQSNAFLGYQSTPVVAFDWAYDFLPQSLRDSVGTYLGNWLDTGGWDNDLGRYPWIPAANVLEKQIALYGHGYVTVSEDDRLLANREKVAYTDTETGTYQGFLGALDVVASGGGINGYSGVRYGTMIALTEALRSALGDDYRAGSPFLRNQSKFWTHRLRPDQVPARNVGKWDVKQNFAWLYHAWVASSYGDQWAQYQAKRVLDDPDVTGAGTCDSPTNLCQYEAWMPIVWYKPWLPAASNPTELSLYDPGSGLVQARDRWQWTSVPYNGADTTTAIYVTYFNGPDVSGTQAAGHFTINRGKDPLITGNGRRTTDTDIHFYPYYIQSYAWNCLSIYKPGEDLGAASVSCAGSVDFPEAGGQPLGEYINSSTDHSCVDSSLAYWPTADGTYGYHGRIRAFRDTPTYLYVRSDLTEAFTYECVKTKADSVFREFVWVRPEYPSDPSIFVVRDKVYRTDPSYTVKARFHSLYRPEVALGDECACLKDQGRPWMENKGGVYRLPGYRKLTITAGVSEAQAFILSPKAYAGQVNIIGGPNAAGTPWQQSWAPGCPNYNPTDTSYEFWVAGKNYVPQNSPTDRFTDRGNEAGDWTIEAQASSSGTDVELLTAFVVGPSGMAEASAGAVTRHGILNVTIRQGGKVTVVRFGQDGVTFAKGYPDPIVIERY